MPSQAVTLLFAERPSFDFSDLARRAEEISGDEFDYPTFGDYQKSLFRMLRFRTNNAPRSY